MALGAGAYAAGLAANSVKSKHIKDGQVKQADLSPAEDWSDWQSEDFEQADPVTCRSDLGVVEVLVNDWANDQPALYNSAGYYRDPYGVVHLKGRVTRGNCPAETPYTAGITPPDPSDHADSIATLPAGYRPAKEVVFGNSSGESQNQGNGFLNDRGYVHVTATGVVEATSPSDRSWVSLDSLTFRCAPSGADGCP